MYDWLYRRRLTPWVAAGHSQARLVTELLSIEEDRHGTGRTLLDLGCGTGEHSLSAARRGWSVIGVDTSATAIHQARLAAQTAGLNARFIVGDVRRLSEIADLPPQVSVFVDVGCYHGLSIDDRRLVTAGVHDLAAPLATVIMVGLDRPPGIVGVGVTLAGLAADFPDWVIDAAETFELGVRGPLRRARFRVFRLTRDHR